MKKNFTLIFAMLLCFFYSGTKAQTQFWSDTFEDAGAPSSGSRTPSIAEFTCGGPPATAYFMRTVPTGVALQNGSYSGFQGSKIWAAEDIDKGPTCTNNAISANQQVTWSGINITGKTGLSFKGLLAADNLGGWQGLNFGTAQDFVIIEYRIDGGAWTKALAFYSNVPAASPASSNTLDLDTNGDMIGDGASLTYTFTEYSANLMGTGTTLDLRLNIFANAGATQEVAADDFRLFETPTCTAPIITSNPSNRSICVGSNTTFSASATGATAYQWQVNTGSGFTNISNGGVYSGATTGTLTITGATAAMHTYQYRAVAINGVATCFTNSNAGTLNISNITTTGSQTNITCFGANTGNASVTPSGGIGSYTYSWSPSGGTGSIATGLVAGTYTVTVTDAIGCTATRTYTITQPASGINLTAGSQTNVSCRGGTNGTATVTPSGGTAPYTYSWSPSGGTAATATGLMGGSYTVTVTDANACQATRTFTITQPAAAINLASGSQTNISCNGGTNGTATVAPTGGTAPYTYSWSPSGGTAAAATGLAVGTYTVTVTDANSCQATRTFTITQPAAAISLSAGSQNNISCNGGSNGTATVTPTGGTAPYTYSWSPSGGTAATATGLAVGTYTVTVTDANACQSTRSFTITQPAAAISLSAGSQNNISCNGGSNGTATVVPTGGTAPYTYSWSPSGGTAATATGLAAGTYTVTVTDVNSCQATRTFTITQPAAAISLASGGQTNISCNGGANGTATVAPTGGTAPYTYSWSPSGGTTATATGLAAGTYTVTVTDANSCQATRSFTITQPAAISLTSGSQTNISCNGGTNGTATVAPIGGTAPYTYSWSPSGGTAATATGLAVGTYTVTVTDANSCQATRTFTITQPAAAISLTSGNQTNISCNGGTNGTATVTPTGGTAPYTYSWSPSGGTAATATGLAVGTYTVTVTDANSCQATRSFTITQPGAAISLTSGSQTNISCFGGTNGTATVAPTGGTAPYTYSWSPSGGTAGTAIGLATGTYTVTVTDANSCQATRSFTITQPGAAISLTSGNQTNISCFGGFNGTATVAPTGGTAPYTYSWSPSGGTAATATGLAAGTYTVTVTDANSCQATRSFTITQPAAISLTSGSQTNISCFGGTNGTATVAPTGGTAPYTYSWSPSGGTAGTATGLATGTYTVTVTDANSCQATRSFTITQPALIDNTLTVVGTILTANQSSATYQWIDCNNGNLPIATETNQSFTPTVSGNYAVIITVNSCSSTSNCHTVLGNESFGLNKEFLIYPNPSNGIISISSQLSGNFQIVNQLGQIVKNFKLQSGIVQTIVLENVVNGVYYLIGQSDEGIIINKKIILAKQ